MSGCECSGMALLTDFYQLTMAYGYWKTGKYNDDAVFNLFFRNQPFGGGFSIACGLQSLVEFVSEWHFRREDLDYLNSHVSANGKSLFPKEFLDCLAEQRFSCDIDAIPEGTAVFAGEPLIRVHGPLLQCQLLESAMLNIINFQTLIATKAARICLAAQNPVFEFGLRRAHGPDGSLSASRAAFAGGCAGTSNALAGKRFGIPVKGTHAHSWVMAFNSEPESFEALAEVMPDSCILLVDTYDTISGVNTAARLGRRMKDRGRRLAGIRLDSGDIVELSRTARRILDESNLHECRIMAGNELDEYRIAELRRQGAAVDYWSVGTRLVTGSGEGAFSGVYKMAACRAAGGDWRYKIKLTDDPFKRSWGGLQRVRRYMDGNRLWGDMIYDEQLGAGDQMKMPDSSVVKVPASARFEELLSPVFRKGRLVGNSPSLEKIRERTIAELRFLPEGLLGLKATETYPVGLEMRSYELNERLAIDYRYRNFSETQL